MRKSPELSNETNSMLSTNKDMVINVSNEFSKPNKIKLLDLITKERISYDLMLKRRRMPNYQSKRKPMRISQKSKCTIEQESSNIIGENAETTLSVSCLNNGIGQDFSNHSLTFLTSQQNNKQKVIEIDLTIDEDDK